MMKYILERISNGNVLISRCVVLICLVPVSILAVAGALIGGFYGRGGGAEENDRGISICLTK
jgi:hypothetical protein